MVCSNLQDLVFESVRAIVNCSVFSHLHLHEKLELLEEMRFRINSDIQLFELEYEKIAIVGSLRDLYLCQVSKLGSNNSVLSVIF